MPEKKLNFLHLSDIHFRQPNGNDLDSDLRNELERDVKELHKVLGKTDAILVTGDLAFHGREDEYIETITWLENISKIVECETTNICTVPGNHDLDWDKQKGTFKLMVDKIHSADPSDLERILDSFLYDDESSEILFRPLANYNNMALLYNCITEPQKNYWEKNFTLNDLSTLRIRGMNSSIISTKEDDDGARKLLLSEKQYITKNYDGVTYITLCHHPFSWLKNSDKIEDYLNDRVSLQLFGHKHRQRIHPLEKSLRLSSGAVHPSVNEPGWEPRYNYIQMYVSKIDVQRFLNITIWPRIFCEEEPKFIPHYSKDGSAKREYKYKLDSWDSPISNLSHSTNKVEQKGESMKANELRPDKKSDKEIKEIIYKFYSLPYSKFLAIASKLELINEDDKEGMAFYKYKLKIMERIKKADLFDQLAKELSNTGDKK